MSFPKAVFDRQNKGNIVTTIVGIIAILGNIAVAMGWLSPEQSTQVTGNLTGIANDVQSIVIYVLGIIAVFSPAPTVEDVKRLFTFKKAA